MFSTGIMDSLSMLQSKVLGLEHVVDRIGQILVHGGRHSNLISSKLVKQSQTVPSPRLSTCSSRPSVDIRDRPSSFSAKNSEIWEEKAPCRNRSSNATKEAKDMWTDPTVKNGRKPTGKDNHKRSGLGTQPVDPVKKTNSFFASATSANARLNSESKNNVWQCVKGYLCDGDLESAYVEALCAGDELVLIELVDRTGPILECLSHKTISDLLSILASYFLEQRFMNSIIPWLQQASQLPFFYTSVSPNSIYLPSCIVLVCFLKFVVDCPI